MLDAPSEENSSCSRSTTFTNLKTNKKGVLQNKPSVVVFKTTVFSENNGNKFTDNTEQPRHVTTKAERN